MSDTRGLRSVFAYSARFRHTLPILIALGILGSVAESFGISLIFLLLGLALGSPGVGNPGGALGKIYDTAMHYSGGSPAVLAGFIFAFVLTRILMNMTSGLINSRLRHTISEEMRLRLFDAYLHMPYSQFRDEDTGTLHDTIAMHSWSLADAFAKVARMGANIGSIVVFGVFVMVMSPPAAIIAGIGSGILFLFTAMLHHRAMVLGELSLKANATMTDRLLTSLEGARTIRAYGRERWAAKRYRAASSMARKLYQASERLQILLFPINEIAYLLLLAGIATSSTMFGVAPSATFAAILILYRLQPQLSDLESNRLALAGHYASIDAVEKQLANCRQREPDGTLGYPGIAGGIRFEGVDFRYDPDQPLLENASFLIPDHGMTVLSGPSGIGKTTIVNLILRLYSPEAGRILAGGTPIADIRRRDWLSHIAVAGQDAELIPGSIIQNIRFGRLNARESEVMAAIEAAGIADAIPRLPDGLQTHVGERGTNLSGGQRQRIGIARALLRDPDILILDEATNSVEQRLEASILDRIVESRKGRITILITHRSVVLDCAPTIIDVAALTNHSLTRINYTPS